MSSSYAKARADIGSKSPAKPPNTEQRRKLAAAGKAMPGGSSGGRFPIRNAADLAKAIKAVGRAGGGAAGQAAVRRFIMKRAKALGLTNMIPASWGSDGSLKSGA